MNRWWLPILASLACLCAAACQRQAPPAPTPQPVAPPAAPAGSQEPIPRSVPDANADTPFDETAVRAEVERILGAGQSLTQYHPFMRVIARRLSIRPGQRIADIGAGTGLFVLALLEEKTPAGEIVAVDVNSRSLEFFRYLLERSQLPGRERVRTAVSRFDDVTLPARTLDVAVVINTPFFLEGRAPGGPPQPDAAGQRCLVSLLGAMKVGGRVHVFQTPFLGTWQLTADDIVAPFTRAGFTLDSVETFDVEMTRFHAVFRRP